MELRSKPQPPKKCYHFIDQVTGQIIDIDHIYCIQYLLYNRKICTLWQEKKKIRINSFNVLRSPKFAKICLKIYLNIWLTSKGQTNVPRSGFIHSIKDLVCILTSMVCAVEAPYILTNMRKILKLFSSTSSYTRNNNLSSKKGISRFWTKIN